MGKERRAKRCVRLLVAMALVGGSAALAIAALAADEMVGGAAVFAVIAGGCAVWMLHTEVLQTRAFAADARAEQARRFQVAWAQSQQSQRAFASSAAETVRRHEARIDVLGRDLMAARRRCDEAELHVVDERRRAETAEARLRLESQRAKQAQERLAGVLDEVFGTTLYDADDDRPANRRRRPAVIDMREWETRLQA